MDDLLTLATELAFAAVFVAALVRWVRRRDVISRDVALVFAATAAVFLLEVAGRFAVALPQWLTIGAVLFLLAQPILTLNLVADLGLLRRRTVLWALFAFVVTATPLVALPDPVPAVAIAAVSVFFVSGALAAVRMAAEARRRTGAARVRLAVGASATVLFGAALLVAGFGSASEVLAESAGMTARVLALVSALGYVLAFMPPPWLRRIWQVTAAFDYTQRLLQEASAVDDPDALWERLAVQAREVTGARAAAVVIDDGGVRLATLVGAPDSGLADAGDLPTSKLPEVDTRQRIDDAPASAAAPWLRWLATSVGGRLYTLQPFEIRAGRGGALILIAERPSLFHDDDRALLDVLCARTAVLVERAEVVARQDALAQQLAATVDALRSASQAKSDFLASMSHELRTPLSAIIGFSELMRSEPPADEGRVTVPLEWIEHIHRSGGHLLGLINDVLDLTKVEAGRIELQREEIDLRPAISEAIEGVRPLAERRRHRLVTDVAPALVDADRGRLRQILYNLLSNAIKFTPDDGTIRVEVVVRDTTVSISVVDSGVGIALDDQQRVFEEFAQVGDVEARRSGTGLGLALTRRLVEAHGGSIELESAPGRGSRFTVILPAAAPPAARSADAPRDETFAGLTEVSEDGQVATRASRSADVLIIEDDPSAVRLLRTYLEGDGHAVRVAVDGEQGIEEARRQPPAAIILDVLLPGLDGWEVLRRLKADPALRDIPVVVVTVVDERELGLALGAVDYYLKPVDRAALLERLARYTFTTKVQTRPVRILAIDDDPAALELVRAALVPEGFGVDLHTDGAEAVSAARDEAFDLVICDLVMPGLDGFEVIAQLRADPRTREVPILVLTAQTLTPEAKARLNGNIIGIVEKGADARRHLLDWLNRAVPGANS